MFKKISSLMSVLVLFCLSACTQPVPTDADAPQVTYAVGREALKEAEDTPAPTPEITATPEPTPMPRVYDAGRYTVGVDMEPGEYQLQVDSEGSAATFIVTKKADDQETVVCTDSFTYNTLLTVAQGQTLKLVDCSASLYDPAEPPWNPGEERLPVGTYRVGGALTPGRYTIVSTGEHGGYWEILRDSLHLGSSVIKNEQFNGTTTVELKTGEYVKLLDAEILLFDS